VIVHGTSAPFSATFISKNTCGNWNENFVAVPVIGPTALSPHSTSPPWCAAAGQAPTTHNAVTAIERKINGRIALPLTVPTIPTLRPHRAVFKHPRHG
jgi:hypothetical protein